LLDQIIIITTTTMGTMDTMAITVTMVIITEILIDPIICSIITK
jgi:hypothetical protein